MSVKNSPIIKPNEHVFTCGMTQSGKSYLSNVYLAGFPNVIVLDTKGLFKWSHAGEVPVFETLASLIEYKNEHVEGKAIYRPIFQELNKETYHEFFKWIYFRKNCIVYVDEIMQVCQTTQDIPEFCKGILTRGMERNTALWGSTQRPKTIPITFMSEATHFFIFQLSIEGDRKRVTEFIPHDEIVDQPLNKYEFWYYTHGLEKPILAKLKKRGG